MPDLRVADGEKRFLLSLLGMWQHERLLVEPPDPVLRQSREICDICGTLCQIGRATDRDGRTPPPTHPSPRGWVPVPALSVSMID